MRLVLDWDGTVTVRDTQWMLLERFGDRELFARLEGALGTTHGYREVMELEVGTITVPLEEAVAFLVAEAEVRAGFRELVELGERRRDRRGGRQAASDHERPARRAAAG